MSSVRRRRVLRAHVVYVRAHNRWENLFASLSGQRDLHKWLVDIFTCIFLLRPAYVHTKARASACVCTPRGRSDYHIITNVFFG